VSERRARGIPLNPTEQERLEMWIALAIVCICQAGEYEHLPAQTDTSTLTPRPRPRQLTPRLGKVPRPPDDWDGWRYKWRDDRFNLWLGHLQFHVVPNFTVTGFEMVGER
jgi:hypothetical protein